jgi:hypothetical protein
MMVREVRLLPEGKAAAITEQAQKQNSINIKMKMRI